MKARRIAPDKPAKPKPLAEQELPPKPPPPTWEMIRDEVAKQANVERWALSKGSGCKLSTVALRQLAVTLTRRLTGLSLPAIARQ